MQRHCFLIRSCSWILGGHNFEGEHYSTHYGVWTQKWPSPATQTRQQIWDLHRTSGHPTCSALTGNFPLPLLGLLKIKWWLLVLLAPSYPLCTELSVLWSNISRVTSKWRCGSGEWLPWLHIWRGLCSFHQSLGHSRHGLRQGCAGMEWAPLLWNLQTECVGSWEHVALKPPLKPTAPDFSLC